eukprot:10199382-Ditylum_brightwellii.AAC.1
MAPDLETEVMGEKYKHLIEEQHKMVLGLLKKYERLFQGKRGEWQGRPVTLRLNPGTKPYMAKTYPVPLPQHEQVKKEINWQCET